MKNDIYKNSSYSIDERVKDLMSKMTLEEKMTQLNGVWKNAETFLDEDKHIIKEKVKEQLPFGIGQVARVFEGLSAKEMAERSNEIQKYFIENTRLGIPVLFHEECLHGVMEHDAVSFPHPIAMAGSFNPELVKKMYEYTAKDARSRGPRLALTPVLDVIRDLRWGRTEETFGEDPYLVSEMALAAVTGFQGDVSEKLQDDKVMATLKHFAAHGEPEGGMNCGPANISERVLREVFLYPFKVAVEEGKALSVMGSYNEIDGVPSHASKWLLHDVLRGEFGFKGFVVSDYYAIEQLEQRHKVAANYKEAAKLSIEAGVDIELPEPLVYPNLLEMVKSGEVDVFYIDRAVKNLLYYKFFSGVFDNPYVDPEKAEKVANDPDAVKLSYKLATECVILLKNDKETLPLKTESLKKIAVIGPNANYHSIGGYSNPNINFITILEGMKNRLEGKVEVVYAKGCGITTDDGSWFIDEVKRTDEAEDRKLIKEAVSVAKSSDVIVLCLGGNEQTSREAWVEEHLGDRTDLQLVGLQEELFEELIKLGKPIIITLTHGRPLALTNIKEKADAILDCWYLGQETGCAVADVILGTVNPSGKLAVSVPRSVGHLPVFYNYKPLARRGYLFDDVSPLYPFGFGLSYTQFELSEVKLKESIIKKDESFSILLNVSNTGSYDGAEVIQVYIRDLVSSVTRPVKELKAFDKVFVKAGETKEVTIELKPDTLAFFNLNMDFVVEPGEFEIMVGTSSDDKDLIKLKLVVSKKYNFSKL